MGKVTAVVPVRKGSQRVKSKNTRPFSNTTLLDLKLEVLKYVKEIDEIIVNTDCEKSIAIAKNHGVGAYRREEWYASSNVTNDIHWRHIAEVTDTDILMMAQTTSPMVKVSTYNKAIQDFINPANNYGSINSVSPEKKFLWLNQNPINYEIGKTPKSQDLPNIMSLNFAVTIINKKTMYKTCNVISSNPKFIELDKIQSIDVDDMFDFEFAEFVFGKYGMEWLIND